MCASAVNLHGVLEASDVYGQANSTLGAVTQLPVAVAAPALDGAIADERTGLCHPCRDGDRTGYA